MKVNPIIIIAIGFIINSKCYPFNSTVISKYARVAVWGNNNTVKEAKGNRANILNHRLSPKRIPSTARKKDPQISYQYPVYGPQLTKNKSTEYVPGIGEVILAQDRFEARPLFAYKNKEQAGYTYNVPTRSTLTLTTTASTRDIVVFSENPYDSPYSSYNPPEFKPNNMFSNQPTSLSKDNNKKTQNDVLYASLGPPLATTDDEKTVENNYGISQYEENEHDYENHNPIPNKQFDKPLHSSKNTDNTYYFAGQNPTTSDHQMIQDDMKDESHPGDTILTNLQDDLNGKPPFEGFHGETPEYTAVRAPMPPLYDQKHSFPSYLFDNYHYDNHVYDEIPHTTEAAKEDKRVSSTNYSYYYLGRKLWFIPLYFSIYFIIYVTVLILKSIARHKVRLKYKWYEHDTSAKKSRSMDLNFKGHESLLSNLHNNVSVALEKVAKYDKNIAK